MEAVRLVEFNLKQVLTKLMTHIFGDGRFLHLFPRLLMAVDVWALEKHFAV